MAKNDTRILILEDDAWFREILESLCSEFGEITTGTNIETALNHIATCPFKLLLLDWHLCQPDASAFFSTIKNFQADVSCIALFTVPRLSSVITAMKAGASDILWASQEKSVLKAKIEECLAREKPQVFDHFCATQLADNITEKAMTRKIPLFQARKEFSKTFLQQVLSHDNLRKTQVADFLNVSPRTLYRHLSS